MSNRAYAPADARWIVRRDARFRARYYQGPWVPSDFRWGRWQRGAWRMTRDEADVKASEIGGRVVRLLSAEESVARARAAGRSEAFGEVVALLERTWANVDGFSGRLSMLDEVTRAVRRMADPRKVEPCPF